MPDLKWFSLVAFVVVACSKADSRVPPEPSNALKEAVIEKTAKLRDLSDHDSGFPDAHDCDGLLWAGLAKAADQSVHLEAAEYEPGHMHRRPKSVGPCWTPEKGDVGSKSTISNDMLTGYMWGIWRSQDLEAAKRLASYGEDHNWTMGDPWNRVGEVYLTTNGRSLLGSIIYSLSKGADDRPYRREGSAYSPFGKDYQRHLTALGISLQGELGTADDVMTEVVKTLRSSDPSDWTFAAVNALFTGDYASAEALLLDPATLCPSYTRGSEVNCLTSWLFAARLVTGGK